MKRKPYQTPQTGMERYIASLVTMLSGGEHNRAEFAAAVEDAMAHAFYLEETCERLRKDHTETEKILSVKTPPLMTTWDVRPTATTMQRIMEWRLEPIIWRTVLSEFQSPDDRNWQRIRHATYRQLLKLMRVQFERTFPKYQPRPDEKECNDEPPTTA